MTGAKDKPPLTYKDAGVDVDAGAALVEAIKPLARTTARSGVVADLGGFGAMFDLKETGYADPLLVAATDGVGTKLKVAVAAGRHDTVGIDLVAMCVNDLVVQGAEPLFFLDYMATPRLDVDEGRALVAGIAEVTVGDDTRRLATNQSAFIPLGGIHRLANPGADLLIVIEVQYGDYLGEDDIERLADDFDRSAEN